MRASQLISKQTYWRSGAVLAHEGNRALVKADREDKKIFIWVDGAQATRRQLLGIIRAHFAHIHYTITGIEVAGKVPVPGRPDVVLDYQNLLTLESMGKKHWTVPELRADVDVKQLLDGVESVQERREQQQNFSKYDLRGARIQNFAPEGEETALMAGETIENSTAMGTQSSERLFREDESQT